MAMLVQFALGCTYFHVNQPARGRPDAVVVEALRRVTVFQSTGRRSAAPMEESSGAWERVSRFNPRDGAQPPRWHYSKPSRLLLLHS